MKKLCAIVSLFWMSSSAHAQSVSPDPVIRFFADEFKSAESRSISSESLREGRVWYCSFSAALSSRGGHFSEGPQFQFARTSAGYENKFKLEGERVLSDQRYTLRREGLVRNVEIRLLIPANRDQQGADQRRGLEYRAKDTVRVLRDGSILAEHSISDRDFGRFVEYDKPREVTADASSAFSDRKVYGYTYCPISLAQ
jgi:hypothetical protein